ALEYPAVVAVSREVSAGQHHRIVVVAIARILQTAVGLGVLLAHVLRCVEAVAGGRPVDARDDVRVRAVAGRRKGGAGDVGQGGGSVEHDRGHGGHDRGGGQPGDGETPS